MVPTRPFAVLGLFLALGLALFGIQISRAVKNGREFDRFLTVRGVSEREVKATLAIWPIRFGSSAEDLPTLKRRIEGNKGAVLDYLNAQGLSTTNVSFGLPVISDRSEEPRRNEERSPLPRYKGITTLVIRSSEVDRVKQAVQNADTLLEKGVTLEYSDRAEFIYEKLNDLKPDMIRDATQNARAAAKKFAQDSRANVGSIRKATQGVFQIDDRDIATPEQKIVRVVTTVEFFIE